MKTKAPQITAQVFSETSPIVSAFFEFGYLKQLFRQGWLLNGISAERCESVAEHSFGVAVIGMLLVEAYFPDMDMLKILKMSLIHDFGEVYAGDFTPAEGISPREKHQLEKESVTRIFERIPQGEIYLALWEDFESGTSPEAQLVRQLDKLEMALQASYYEHQAYGNLTDFYTSAAQHISDPRLRVILDDLLAIR